MSNDAKVQTLVAAVVLVAIVGGGIFMVSRVRQLQTFLEGRDSRIQELESELGLAQAALRGAESLAAGIRVDLEGIRAERDTLVEKFGVIRAATLGLTAATHEGADIIDASLGIVDVVIEILTYLEGIRIY